MGMGPVCQTSLPLAFPSGGWATFPTHGLVPYSYLHFRKKIHLGIKTMFIYLILKVWVPLVMSGSELGDRDGKRVREIEPLKQLK